MSRFSIPGARTFSIVNAKNQFEYCHQVALPYQPCSNNEDLYQSICGVDKCSSQVFEEQSLFKNTYESFDYISRKFPELNSD